MSLSSFLFSLSMKTSLRNKFKNNPSKESAVYLETAKWILAQAEDWCKKTESGSKIKNKYLDAEFLLDYLRTICGGSE